MGATSRASGRDAGPTLAHVMTLRTAVARRILADAKVLERAALCWVLSCLLRCGVGDA